MLVSLSAHGYRNLEPLVWRPGPGSHLVVGDNGAGKTSLLEAIYVLATTKSFRTAQLADCARHGGRAFHLEGEAESLAQGGARAHLAVRWEEGVKSRAVNGKPTSLAEHLAALPLVSWTAADADLTTGPPELRRRLLDRGIVGLAPGAIEILGRYRRALAAKRELLVRPPAGGPRGRRSWESHLEPWNELLAAAGAEIIRLRRRYAERLAEELATAVAVAALPFPPIEIAYRPSPSRGVSGAEEIAARLRRVIGRERERGRPLVGPHRDELAIRWGGRPLRGTVSAGERKAFGLLLLAAHGRVLAAAGRPPIYLLDDADAELSPATLSAVWRLFADAGQLFASSNRPRAWAALAVRSTHCLEGGRLDGSATPAETS